MVSDVRNALGGMWEGGKCVPPPPGGEKKNCPCFGYEVVPGCGKLLRLETEVVPRCGSFLIFMADDLLERAARRPAATASCLQLHALPHRHPLMNRSGSARGRHGFGRAVTCHSAGAMLLSKHLQRPAAGSTPAQADARQGLLHGRALLPSQGLEEVRRASRRCILLPWLQLCLARLSPVFSHGMLLFSLCAYPAGGCFLPRSPGRRRGGSKAQNSRVALMQSFTIRELGKERARASVHIMSGCA